MALKGEIRTPRAQVGSLTWEGDLVPDAMMLCSLWYKAYRVLTRGVGNTFDTYKGHFRDYVGKCLLQREFLLFPEAGLRVAISPNFYI